MIQLNLGSHNKPIGDEYINIDIQELDAVDARCDLSIIPFALIILKPEKFGDDWDLFEDQLSGRTSVIIKDNSIDEIVMEEVLEHLSFKITHIVLKEIFRILKIGGKLKIQVPDCGAAMKAWLEKKVCDCVPHKAFVTGIFKPKKDCPKCGGKAIMDWDRWLFSFMGCQKNEWDFHRAIFTKEIMDRELRHAGFSTIKYIDNQVKIKVEVIK